MVDFLVTHSANPERKIFVSYDSTHIIKNVRNQMIDRNFVKDEEKIDFGLIKLIFQKTRRHSFHMCRYLTRKHVYPTNNEKMKVNLSIDIFRPETVASLRTMSDLNEIGFSNVEPLCRFLE